jgi:hypothetical protein
VAKECSSDFACGIGHRCLKDWGKVYGFCAKSVDEFGVRNSIFRTRIGFTRQAWRLLVRYRLSHHVPMRAKSWPTHVVLLEAMTIPGRRRGIRGACAPSAAAEAPARAGRFADSSRSPPASTRQANRRQAIDTYLEIDDCAEERYQR